MYFGISNLCQRIVNLSGPAIWGERKKKGKKSNQLVAKVVKKQKERPVSRFDDDAQGKLRLKYYVESDEIPIPIIIF